MLQISYAPSLSTMAYPFKIALFNGIGQIEHPAMQAPKLPISLENPWRRFAYLEQSAVVQ